VSETAAAAGVRESKLRIDEAKKKYRESHSDRRLAPFRWQERTLMILSKRQRGSAMVA
jgi:hypothetical protein